MKLSRQQLLDFIRREANNYEDLAKGVLKSSEISAEQAQALHSCLAARDTLEDLLEEIEMWEQEE